MLSRQFQHGGLVPLQAMIYEFIQGGTQQLISGDTWNLAHDAYSPIRNQVSTAGQSAEIPTIWRVINLTAVLPASLILQNSHNLAIPFEKRLVPRQAMLARSSAADSCD